MYAVETCFADIVNFYPWIPMEYTVQLGTSKIRCSKVGNRWKISLTYLKDVVNDVSSMPVLEGPGTRFIYIYIFY
jgi:hypothetical protein